MIEIMLEMSNLYTPVIHRTKVDEMTEHIIDDDAYHAVLFGGDQLTRKRMETAKEMARNGDTTMKRLHGLIPVCTDWHTKRVLLEVSMHRCKHVVS